MASGSRVITLDVGTATAKLAEFQVSSGGQLTLNRFGIRELGLDPNKEESRFPVVTSAVQELLTETGIKPGPATLSISGQSVFLRFVKLPPVDAVQVEQLIGFEAQQNLPFAMHEVVWDYQMMPSRAGTGESEAIIVAMKSDLLEGELRAAETAGLTPELIDVSPLALYNAFRYNYGAPAECTLLIDMGARTTNLLFIEGGNLYTRGIPIAGNMLSQNICNELQEPFVAAETLKKGKGFVHLGGAYADPDDRDAARISKLIRTTFTRLHNEINRSMAFYRTQQGGTAPTRVLLTGGTSQLPYVDVFFGEKLGLPVEYFNPLANVALAPTLDMSLLSDRSCYVGELVGLALRQSGGCPIEVALTSADMAEKKATARKRPMFYAAVVMFLVLMMLPSLANWRESMIAEQIASTIGKKVSSVSRFKASTAKAAKASDAAQLEFDAVRKLLAQRNDWLQILGDINATLPEGVWLTRLTPQYEKGERLYNIDDYIEPERPRGAKGAAPLPAPAPEVNRLALVGLLHANQETMSLNANVVTVFLDKLKEFEWVDAEKSDVRRTDSPDNQKLALTFEIDLALKNPIDIKP